ncbi:hypothetical protein [Nocardia carnea]|uniref:hypothetical protein n=1 Tax=Nocardia carnea TaxID=37328 RepID=UPI00245808E9|nr:hypothetical protein [Nocardia carnea]
MRIHYSTAVGPATDTGFDWDIPLLVLGGETLADVANIPLPTSLHRVGNEIMPYTHATMRDDIGPIPVSVGADHRDILAIMIDPVVPTALPGWAHQMIGG